MVKVPSSDRVHVISAWIVPKEKTLNKINSMCFFIMEINEIGRRPSEILVLHFRLRPRNLHNWQVRKSPCPKRTRNSSLTCSRCWKLVVFKVKRTKAKSSMYYLCRENRLSLTQVDKLVIYYLADTSIWYWFRLGERYRSSDWLKWLLSVSY